MGTRRSRLKRLLKKPVILLDCTGRLWWLPESVVEVVLVVGKRDRSQQSFQLVGPLRSFLPDDHILVQIDAVLDLSWLEDEVRGFYSADTGRPSIPPEAVVRLMLSGLLEGIVHDRALLRRAQTDLAIRWFIGYGLDEDLPDHSTLTRVRQRWGAGVFERVFEKTVEQCLAAGLIDASVLHVDSTLIRADASPDSFVEEHMLRVRAAHGMDEQGGKDSESADDGDDDPPPPRGDGRETMGDVELDAVSQRSRQQGASKKRRVSQTDGECRFGRSSGSQRYTPSYKAHLAVENAAGIIVGAGLTAGHVHDSEALISLLARTGNRLGNGVEQVAADRAYGVASNFEWLAAKQIEAIIGVQSQSRHKGGVPASRFSYDPWSDQVRCPGKRHLYRGRRVTYGVEYRSRARDCRRCHHASRCLSPSSKTRTIVISPFQASLVRARRRQYRGEIRNHELWGRRWACVERVFGEAKSRHGLRRVARRGLANAWTQVVLTCAVQNLRRLAKYQTSLGSFLHLYRATQAAVCAILVPPRGIRRPNLFRRAIAA